MVANADANRANVLFKTRAIESSRRLFVVRPPARLFISDIGRRSLYTTVFYEEGLLLLLCQWGAMP